MDEDKTPPEELEPTEPLDTSESGPPKRIGPYRILQKIGEGGMGARDTKLDRQVAQCR